MRVLVAENDFQLVDSLAERLRRESFVVENCKCGIMTVDMIRKARYDVVILNRNLPGMSGFEVISALRSLGDKTPIIMTAEKTTVEDRVLALNLGADDFLEKHFSLCEMIARIKTLTRRRTDEASNILRSRDLVLNLSNMTVTREGNILELTRKECGILAELLRHKGRILSREDLIEAVWGSAESLKYSNTLDVHIRTLRKKVDRPYKEKRIRTIRGHGYLLE